MKNRIFYVIHLDIERILVLFLFLFFIIFLSFYIGFRMGKNQIKSSTEITLNSPNFETLENKKEKEESVDRKNTIPIEELKKAEKFSNKELKKQEIELRNVEENKSLEKQKEETKQVKKEENPIETEEAIKKKSNLYIVQIGAYKKKEEANQILNQLKEFGIECLIQKKKNLYIVYSNANSLESAKKIKKDLEKLNFKDSMIIKNK